MEAPPHLKDFEGSLNYYFAVEFYIRAPKAGLAEMSLRKASKAIAGYPKPIEEIYKETGNLDFLRGVKFIGPKTISQIEKTLNEKNPQ